MDRKTLDTLAEQIAGRLFVPLEASGRHVHLTAAQAQALFGHDLTPCRGLSQPGQYLCQERLTVKGPKGELKNVAVLGPVRKEAQVEVSLTDARVLGLTPPVRQSGDVKGSPGAVLVGPQGTVTLPQGVIAAQRHIHLDPGAARQFGVRDKQVVKLQTYTARPVLWQQVTVRVSPDYAPAVHLDIDEANACGLKPGDLGRIVP
ncbi:MAG: phosphate propanoyltransferase [Clostridia bacterium]|nr:phosphate propanoyltransferase [Clostridia bacterium]